MSTERIETVIIGGGQAGLSTGYHLARRGRPFVILDGNARIGDNWRVHWDSLRLYSPARYDGLPGMPFPAPAWSFPTKDQVAAYLAGYAAEFDLPVRTGVRVRGRGRAPHLPVRAGHRPDPVRDRGADGPRDLPLLWQMWTRVLNVRTPSAGRCADTSARTAGRSCGSSAPISPPPASSGSPIA
jgi:hypothetical protein